MVFALLLAALPDAQAFCGTYVGQAGASIYNNASQVVVVRQGDQTTLTLANDLEGDVTDFALVMPVPQVLTADDVQTVDPELIKALDQYSAPRLVRYECTDFEYYSDSGNASDTGATGGGGGGGEADGVVVEATFTEGEYLIQVVSAEAADPLITWLNDNGYAMSAEAETLLGEYIHDGAYFVAAKVNLAAAATAPTYLTPLQFSYTAAAFSLPIRLGTLNSQGSQDLIVYALTDYEKGAVSVASSAFPQVELEDDCMWRDADTAGSSFGDFYNSQFDRALGDAPAGWAQEYAWGTGGCDPCSGTPPDDAQVAALGFVGSAYDAFFTRLHLRYTPEAATEDLVLYESNITDLDQIKFIAYRYELEDRFPICGEGMAEDPGSCDDDVPTDSGDGGGSGSGDDGGSPVPDPNGFDLADTVKEPSGCAYGCASGGGDPLAALGLLGGIGLLWRRRRA